MLEGFAGGSPAYGTDSAVRCLLQKAAPPTPVAPPATAPPVELGAMGGALAAMEAALSGADSIEFGSAAAHALMEWDCSERPPRVLAASQGLSRAMRDEEAAIVAAEKAAQAAADAEKAADDTTAPGGFFRGTTSHVMLGSLATSLALLEKLEGEPAQAAPRHALAWPPSTDDGESVGDITWWRGRWCAPPALLARPGGGADSRSKHGCLPEG